MKKFISLIIISMATILVTACGGTWVIQGDSTSVESSLSISEMAIIERHESRESPEIKYFYHFDLTIAKKCYGSDYNPLVCPDRILSPPGRVYIGSPLRLTSSYYPDIRFNVEGGRKYILTWVCSPYPVSAIANAENLKIVAVDSYCPDCEYYLEMTIGPSNECKGYWLHPPGMKPDRKKGWIPWIEEVKDFYSDFKR